jgi:thioredoxin 1
VEEGHAVSARPRSDPRGNYFEPGGLGPSDRGPEIGDSKADVVDARSSLLQMPGDRRIGIGRLEKFNAPGSVAEQRDSDSFGGNFLFTGDVESENGRPDRDGLGEGFDRDSNVVDLVQANSLQERISTGRAFSSTPASESNLGVKRVQVQHEIGECDVASAEIKQITDQNFGAEIESSEGLAIVDFWAEWCGPCRMVGPIIAELAEEYAGKVKVGKLDVDENRVTAGRFSIRSIPSVLYFKDGELVDAVAGAYPKKYLEEKILEYV